MKKIGILTSGEIVKDLMRQSEVLQRDCMKKLTTLKFTVFKTVMPDLSTVITRR